MRFDSLPSTNTEAARQAASGAREGLCVVAREQTEGRGRRERVWLSPLDAGLYFSLLLRPRILARDWPLITLTAAIAVSDALLETCALAADIKWPNDIICDGRKLCGILAETVETQKGRACIVGVGVNLVDEAFPSGIASQATSIEAQTGSAPEPDALLRAIVRALARRYDQLHDDDGAARIVCEWESRSSFARGRRVRIVLADETFEGTTRGLEPDGALRVETDAGVLRPIRAGDVVALRREE